jgi:cell division protein FtsQ
MWDDAMALRRVSNALYWLSAALILFSVLHYAIHSPLFALRTVQLSAPLQRVNSAQVQEVVRHKIRGNFFTVDLAEVRHAFEQLGWVRRVTVRRLFPWTLEVTLDEYNPLAHWNADELVDADGNIFNAKLPPGEQVAPVFTGPDGLAPQVTQNYLRFAVMLTPLKQQVTQVNLSPRGAWQLKLQGGMALELGRDQIEARLARFIAAWPLSGMDARTRYVDLRYRNGFAAGTAG